jgi:hydroxypyruvate reductase
MRRLALDLYRHALGAVQGDRVVCQALRSDQATAPLALISIGKAACAMAAGALRQVGDRIESGLVITRHGYTGGIDGDRLRVLSAGHPVPDADSLVAGQELLRFIGGLAPDRHLLVLLSGGTSSLVEVLPPHVDLATLARVNQWLLASGLDIHQVNCVRSALSEIKGGGLIPRIAGRPTRVLLMSDVPGDEPASIGSGLLVPAGEARQPSSQIPAWLADLIRRGSPHLASEDGPPRNIAVRIVARNRDALEAASARARQLEIRAVLHDRVLTGDPEAACETIVSALDGPTASGSGEAPPTVHLWGGELTPSLPQAPGRGGRCQHLALMLAARLAGRSGMAVLCAGTDGSDGPGEDAGALVDGQTLVRGRDGGEDPQRCLREANSGCFLEAAGDLVSTGPTNTNVMDVVIGLTGFTSPARGIRLAPGLEELI